MLPEPQQWGLLALDPDVLEGMTEPDWRDLCSQLRHEQVRRWTLNDQYNTGTTNKTERTKGNRKSDSKRVTFLLDDKGNPKTFVFGETPVAKGSKTVIAVPSTKNGKDLNFLTRYQQVTEDKENQNRPKEVERYDNVVTVVNPHQDLDEDDRRLNLLLEESRSHIYNLEQQKEREREEWLNRKKNQLRERQKLSSVSSSSSMSSSPNSTPPSSPIYNLDVGPFHHQNAALLLAQQASDDVHSDHEASLNRSDSEKISEIARRARTEHRRISGLDRGRSLSTPEAKHGREGAHTTSRRSGGTPLGRAAIIEWFQREELPKGAGLDPSTNSVATWFHGIISRSESERLLSALPVGSYLVRVSEKIWGYAVSYRTYDRYRHFLIEVANGQYKLIGAGHQKYPSLADLVKYHRTRPVSNSGQEYLIHPCPQATAIPDYLELFGENTSPVIVGKTNEKRPSRILDALRVNENLRREA